MEKLKRFLNTGKYLVLGVAVMVISGFSQSTMTINVTGATNVVHKEIFGVLMERLGRQWTSSGTASGIFVGTGSTIPNTNGMRNDIINGFAECGVGACEWPGGCAANGYAWASNLAPTNDVGTDRFMQFCQAVGAEPVLAGQSPAGQASSNRQWMVYCDSNPSHPTWNVKYFKIGNEVWGCGGNQTEATYEPNYNANYTALHPPVNGKQLFLVAGTGLIGQSWPWLQTMLANIGSKIDGIEIHDYIYYPSTIPSPGFTAAQYWTVVNASNQGQIGPRITTIRGYLNTADAAGRIKVMEDEWGDWFENTGDGWMQVITMLDALSAAETIHLFMANADRWLNACLAQAVNVIHSIMNINATTAVSEKTTTFYIFKLLKPHHINNAKWTPITASNIQTVTGNGTTMPVLTVGSTVDSLGRVNISVSNIDLTATRQLAVTLTSTVATYVIDSAQIVQGAAMNSYNDFGAAENVNIKNFAATNYTLTGKTLTATLPPLSVTMFRLKPSTAVKSESILKNGADAFSVRAGSRGTVLISSLVDRKTPVTISLYGIDGRTLMNRISRTFEAGNSTCALETNHQGNGVYIVKIAGPDIDFSKKVIAER